jgi:hypothetical protein
MLLFARDAGGDLTIEEGDEVVLVVIDGQPKGKRKKNRHEYLEDCPDCRRERRR